MTLPPKVDVIQVSDFRLPGGTSSSIAEEVRTQSRAGLSTALIHTPSTVTSRPIPWSVPIRSVLDLPGVHIATPRSHLRADVLVLRHPTVAASTPWDFARIHPARVIIVANHTAIDGAGTHFYDVEATDTRIREMFGLAPIWAPIGPVVRATIQEQTSAVPLRPEDWVNIFRPPATPKQRTGFVGEVPVIGRHSRPQPGKWPDNAADILAAYPDSEDYRVKILGGARVAEQILGQIPNRWHVIPFGQQEPARFLEEIDFWVYFHHPDLREAFGRAAMEAMASGAVAILPEYLRELFGDAALYATPQSTLSIIDDLYADPERFLVQSARGQQFASGFGPNVHLERLTELGVTRSTSAPGAGIPPRRTTATEPSTTLFVTHDRRGDVGLARLSSAAQQYRSGQSLAIFALITDTTATTPAGVPVEYINGRESLGAPEAQWDSYVTERLGRLLDRLAPDRVVFVGPELPQSILDSVQGRFIATVRWWDGKERDVLHHR